MPRKVFVAGEILTAADVNTNLMDQAVMVFDDSTARGSAIPSPSEGMVTYLKDVNQVQAYDGSSFLPVGTILQVIQSVKTDTFTTTSGTAVDIPDLSVSITPSATTSKILVVGKVDLSQTENDAGFIFIVRDSTTLTVGDAASSRIRAYGAGTGGAPSTGYILNSIPLDLLDSPASTSSLTYKLQVQRGGSGTVTINRTGLDTDSISNPRTVSSITVMEVAG